MSHSGVYLKSLRASEVEVGGDFVTSLGGVDMVLRT
jgi:hypothetical protein